MPMKKLPFLVAGICLAVSVNAQWPTPDITIQTTNHPKVEITKDTRSAEFISFCERVLQINLKPAISVLDGHWDVIVKTIRDFK